MFIFIGFLTTGIILTCVFRETDTQGRFLDLFSEQVFLVEEENDGSVNEEFVVTDGIEQHKRLVHAILQEEKKPEQRIDREKEADRKTRKVQWRNTYRKSQDKQLQKLNPIKSKTSTDAKKETIVSTYISNVISKSW